MAQAVALVANTLTVRYELQRGDDHQRRRVTGYAQAVFPEAIMV